MANAREIAVKHWRLPAFFVLCLVTFFEHLTFLFWIGFAVITSTNPKIWTQKQELESTGPLAYLLIPAVFLIMGTLVAVYYWKYNYFTTFNPFIAVSLVMTSFVGAMALGFFVQKYPNPWQEFLKKYK